MDIERILKTRENAIYYGIGEYQKDCFGWVGGNAPACFDDKYLSDKDNLYFYLTFQNPLNPNKQISIFTPDFDIALEYNTYPDCKLLLVEHELSSQSKSDRYKHPEIDEIYSIYEMSTEKDMPEKNCAIKFGGNVLLIMVRKEHRQMLSFVVSNLFEIINHFIVIRNIPSMPQMDL